LSSQSMIRDNHLIPDEGPQAKASNMTDSDRDLVDAAKSAIKARFRPDWHVVGSALRLRTGEIVTGVHLEANIGRIAVCAEAIALGRAVTEFGSSDVAMIVAVYHASDGSIDVVAPCGMCRGMISDYAPEAKVLMPDEQIGLRPTPIAELLPGKYLRPAGA
jgi:cytidine deaminase